MKKLFDEIPRLEDEKIVLRRLTPADADDLRAFAEQMRNRKGYGGQNGC